MEARLDTPRNFYFLPSTQQLGLSGLRLNIYDDDGQPLSGSPFTTALVTSPTEIATVGVYRAGPITFPAVGAYTLVWSCTSPSIKVMDQVTVLGEPACDFPTGMSRKFRYQTPGSVAATDVLLRIIGPSGAKVGSTLTTAVTAQAGVYETSSAVVLADAGVYLLIWTSATGGYAFTRIEQRLVLPTVTARTVTVVVADPAPDPEEAQVGIDVLVSTTAGVAVDQAKTNGLGAAYFLLEDGDYIVTARRSGYVYDYNNLAITVAAPVDTMSNKFFLLATPFQPTFDSVPLFDVSDKSLMTVDLADMQGQPLCGRKVFVSNRMLPDSRVSIAGVTFGIFGEGLTLVTNGRGHAEVYLLRGQTITTAIEGTPLRRTFEVPDSSTFSLLEVLTGDGDPFDVVHVTTTAAEQGV